MRHHIQHVMGFLVGITLGATLLLSIALADSFDEEGQTEVCKFCQDTGCQNAQACDSKAGGTCPASCICKKGTCLSPNS